MRDTGDVGRYLGGLDGLRGLAGLGVIGAHTFAHFAPVTTPPGVAQLMAQGLTVFFAMSGMLIYLPFVRDIATGQRGVDVRRYARRRLLRIFPAYLLIFGAANLVLHAVYVTNAVDTSTPGTDAGTGLMSDPLTLLLNVTLTQTFVPDAVQTGINPSWSLTTELTFYLLLPVLAVPLVGRAVRQSRRMMLALAPAIALAVAGLVGRGWAEHLYAQRADLTPFSAEFGANGVAVLSRSLLALADNFAVGMVVAVLFVWTERGELPWWTRRRATAAGWTALVVGGALGALVHDSHPWFQGTFTSLTAGGLILLVVDPSARREPSLLVRLADVRPLSWLGEVSLSTYLWHYPVIVLVSRTGWYTTDSVGSMMGSTAVVVAVSVALGGMTYACVERPAMTGELPVLRWRVRQ
jgi:peptidoglycan/LPS O-acetylase OafA/YrhL